MVRLRGELLLFLTSAAAAQDGYAGAFGIGLATASAIAIGVTAVQTPIDDQDWDGWLFHQFVFVRTADALNAAAASDLDQITGHTAQTRVEVDSKAMRKLPEDMSVYAALQVTETGTSVLQAFFNSRMLIKLP